MAPIREMLADTGLTEQQWRVLRVLAEYGPQDATKLAERSCLLLPSLTRILRTMAEKGYVTRRTDDTDRRRQTLEITRAGQEVIDANLFQALQIVDRFKGQIGPERYELLLDLLEELSAGTT